MSGIPGAHILAASTSCSGTGAIMNGQLHVTLNTRLSFDLADLPGHIPAQLAAENEGLKHQVLELERGIQKHLAHISNLENQLAIERSNGRISEHENARLAREICRLTKALKDQGGDPQLDGEKPMAQKGLGAQEGSMAITFFNGVGLSEWFEQVEHFKKVLALDEAGVVDLAYAHMSEEVMDGVQCNLEYDECQGKEANWALIKYWMQVAYGDEN
jgi:hypothetical protein